MKKLYAFILFLSLACGFIQSTYAQLAYTNSETMQAINLHAAETRDKIASTINTSLKEGMELRDEILSIMRNASNHTAFEDLRKAYTPLYGSNDYQRASMELVNRILLTEDYSFLKALYNAVEGPTNSWFRTLYNYSLKPIGSIFGNFVDNFFHVLSVPDTTIQIDNQFPNGYTQAISPTSITRAFPTLFTTLATSVREGYTPPVASKNPNPTPEPFHPPFDPIDPTQNNCHFNKTLGCDCTAQTPIHINGDCTETITVDNPITEGKLNITEKKLNICSAALTTCGNENSLLSLAYQYLKGNLDTCNANDAQNNQIPSTPEGKNYPDCPEVASFNDTLPDVPPGFLSINENFIRQIQQKDEASKTAQAQLTTERDNAIEEKNKAVQNKKTAEKKLNTCTADLLGRDSEICLLNVKNRNLQEDLDTCNAAGKASNIEPTDLPECDSIANTQCPVTNTFSAGHATGYKLAKDQCSATVNELATEYDQTIAREKSTNRLCEENVNNLRKSNNNWKKLAANRANTILNDSEEITTLRRHIQVLKEELKKLQQQLEQAPVKTSDDNSAKPSTPSLASTKKLAEATLALIPHMSPQDKRETTNLWKAIRRYERISQETIAALERRLKEAEEDSDKLQKDLDICNVALADANTCNIEPTFPPLTSNNAPSSNVVASTTCPDPQAQINNALYGGYAAGYEAAKSRYSTIVDRLSENSEKCEEELVAAQSKLIGLAEDEKDCPDCPIPEEKLCEPYTIAHNITITNKYSYANCLPQIVKEFVPVPTDCSSIPEAQTNTTLADAPPGFLSIDGTLIQDLENKLAAAKAAKEKDCNIEPTDLPYTPDNAPSNNVASTSCPDPQDKINDNTPTGYSSFENKYITELKRDQINFDKYRTQIQKYITEIFGKLTNENGNKDKLLSEKETEIQSLLKELEKAENQCNEGCTDFGYVDGYSDAEGKYLDVLSKVLTNIEALRKNFGQGDSDKQTLQTELEGLKQTIGDLKKELIAAESDQISYIPPETVCPTYPKVEKNICNIEPTDLPECDSTANTQDQITGAFNAGHATGYKAAQDQYFDELKNNSKDFEEYKTQIQKIIITIVGIHNQQNKDKDKLLSKKVNEITRLLNELNKIQPEPTFPPNCSNQAEKDLEAYKTQVAKKDAETQKLLDELWKRLDDFNNYVVKGDQTINDLKEQLKQVRKFLSENFHDKVTIRNQEDQLNFFNTQAWNDQAKINALEKSNADLKKQMELEKAEADKKIKELEEDRDDFNNRVVEVNEEKINLKTEQKQKSLRIITIIREIYLKLKLNNQTINTAKTDDEAALKSLMDDLSNLFIQKQTDITSKEDHLKGLLRLFKLPEELTDENLLELTKRISELKKQLESLQLELGDSKELIEHYVIAIGSQFHLVMQYQGKVKKDADEISRITAKLKACEGNTDAKIQEELNKLSSKIPVYVDFSAVEVKQQLFELNPKRVPKKGNSLLKEEFGNMQFIGYIDKVTQKFLDNQALQVMHNDSPKYSFKELSLPTEIKSIQDGANNIEYVITLSRKTINTNEILDLDPLEKVGVNISAYSVEMEVKEKGLSFTPPPPPPAPPQDPATPPGPGNNPPPPTDPGAESSLPTLLPITGDLAQKVLEKGYVIVPKDMRPNGPGLIVGGKKITVTMFTKGQKVFPNQDDAAIMSRLQGNYSNYAPLGVAIGDSNKFRWLSIKIGSSPVEWHLDIRPGVHMPFDIGGGERLVLLTERKRTQFSVGDGYKEIDIYIVTIKPFK